MNRVDKTDLICCEDVFWILGYTELICTPLSLSSHLSHKYCSKDSSNQNPLHLEELYGKLQPRRLLSH